MLSFPREEDIINLKLKENKNYFHIIGVPYDCNSVDPSISTKLFPKKFRELSYRIYSTLYSDIRKCYIIDHGDFDIEELRKKIAEINENYKKNNIFFFLGGNHLITYYTVKFLSEIKKIDVILSFDSHPDVYFDKLNNSSFFRHLINEEKEIKIVFLTLSNSSYEELEYLKNKKIKYFSSLEFEENNSLVLKEVNRITKDKNVYITIDLDAFKNNVASFQPEVLGIEVKTFLKFLKELDLGNLIGVDLVEFDPTKDINDSFSLMSTRLGLETLAIINEKLEK